MSLIYTRESVDVSLALSLAALAWDQMTQLEKDLWMGVVGYLSCQNGFLDCADGRLTCEGEGVNYGLYGPVDWNRVEEAVADLADALVALPDILAEYVADSDVAEDEFFQVPYDPADYGAITVKTDWTRADKPTPTQMARYRGNVALLITALRANYPTLPANMQRLTHVGANALEQALSVLSTAIDDFEHTTKKNVDNAVKTWFYSDEIIAGEV